ncbi:hypothetical protein AWZ03_012882 [Drosophila navojoa]|uniref:Putative ionotropic receptor ligand binding domain-containing protein n=1 Tax=Drosophila navojoa TaxID=7232 RepID=A0A484AYP3_DRONA|nr:uncharacterized protein LOC108655581 [Drosophila navojoa]TDG40695.1 hypothetical protein AWZ03_012882 [Drosophila navojoa]
MELNAVHLLLLLGLSCGCPPGQNTADEELATNLSKSMQMIFAQTCEAHDMSVFISTSYKSQLPRGERRLVERVLTHCLGAMVPRVLGERLEESVGLRTQMLLFFVPDARQFIAASNRNPRMNMAHKYKYLIVLMAGRADAAWQRAQMSQIFGYLLHQRYNVHVLLLLAELRAGRVSSYTYYPYSGARGCEDTQALPVPLQQARLYQIYPQKLHNLHGCPLHVVVWQIRPYMRLHMERTRPSDRISGIDADILKVLASRLNFSLALVANEPADLIGGVSYMNGTMTGAFHMLQQRRANLTLGFAACMPARYKHLSSTLPYSQVEYVLVLRTARPYSVYEIMLFPFDSRVWLLVLALAALRLLCWESGWRRVALLDLAWILAVFMLRMCYESSVFMFLYNAPTRPLPDSLEQALVQDYQFITDHATYRMTASLPALRARTRILPGQPVDMLEQLQAQPEWQRVATISTASFVADYLGGQRTKHHRLVLASNKIVDNMICVHFPMGSYLTSNFNHMLFLMRSSGIGPHIVNRLKSSHLATSMSARLNPLKHCADYVAQFNECMRFIYAALNCLLFAHSLALVIFLLELFSGHERMRWLSRILERL